MQPDKHSTESTSGVLPSSSARRSDVLIAQGARELRALELQIEAAKAEAEHAELEALLEEARAGDSAALAEWLEARSAKSATATIQAPIFERAIDPASQPLEGTQDASAEQAHAGWDSPRGIALRNAAKARLLKLAGARSGAAPADADKGKRVSDRPEVDKGSRTKPETHPTANPAILQAVAKTLESTEPVESRRRRRWVGPVVSLVAHVLLLVVLGLVVLKVPSDSAGVALQSASSDRVEQVVEVVEQSEVDAPEESEVSEPTEVVASAADSLTSVSVSDALAASSLDPGPLASEQLSAAAASASTMSGAGNAASFFGAAVGGNNFCYVIDASGSMRGGPWEAAKFELLKSLASLQSGQRYYIIFFNRKLSPMVLDGSEPASTFVYATPENLAKTRRWIETVEIGIGAPPNNALEYAIELEPDAIYLLTDGVTKVDVAAHLEEVNRTESLFGEPRVLTPIHPIAYYSLEGQQLLRRIAAENNGKFIYVPDPRR